MKRGKRNCQSAVIVSSRDFRYRGTPGESSQAVPLTPQQCLNVPPRMPSMWRSESPRADFAHLSMGPLMPSKASFLVYDIIKAGTPPVPSFSPILLSLPPPSLRYHIVMSNQSQYHQGHGPRGSPSTVSPSLVSPTVMP
jgi:hypothetical protein